MREIAEIVAASRAAQGLGPVVTDEATLRRVAEILVADECDASVTSSKEAA